MLPNGLKSKIEWVRVDQIHTDHRINTRPVYQPWVDSHVEEFDPEKLGTPVLSLRDDGTYVVLDGQHRITLLHAVGWGDQKVQCRVYIGLEKRDEAELFLGLNDNRRVGTVYRFLAAVAAGDAVAVAINRAVKRAGWKVHDQKGDGKIVAVRSLEKIYHGDNRLGLEGGIEVVEQVLQIITEAWGYQPDAANGDVMHGLGLLLQRHGAGLDMAPLIQKLSSYPGGPMGLLGSGRSLRNLQGGSVAFNVAEVVLGIYNKSKRTKALPSLRVAA